MKSETVPGKGSFISGKLRHLPDHRGRGWLARQTRSRSSQGCQSLLGCEHQAIVAVVFLLAWFSGNILSAQDNSRWDRLPTGRWVRVATHGVAAPKVFHGGATLAPERGQVFFFGSDTHWPTALERGEANSVWRLDLKTLTWAQDYLQDSRTSYRVLPDGQVETSSGRPWAMHTFDAVEYDPESRRMVVVSFPEHARFEPELRFPSFSGEWFKKLKPGHWEYEPDTKQWSRLETGAPDLFAKGLTWDSDRKQLIGHDGAETYHFRREQGRWETYPAPSSAAGYHLTLVYDTLDRQVLLIGRNGGSNVLYSYDPDLHRWNEVPVSGETLPANGATLAFDTLNHVMLYLANDFENQYHNPTGRSVTFIFHAGDKRWERLDIESPDLYGMNYLMQYDPVRNVFLHFERSPETGDRVTVWAFRYR